MALPPAMIFARAGTSVLTQSVIPATTTAYQSAQSALQAIEENTIDPAVSAIFGAPEYIAGEIGDYDVAGVNVYDIIPGDEETFAQWLREDIMHLDRGEREVTITKGTNIPNQVTIFGASDPVMNRRNMFDMLAVEDGVVTSGTTELQGDETSILAPFSLYFPSSMWPYTSETGNRYTVHDLAEEPIDSDWLGTKPLVEVVMGRRLDKVGALPAYAYWGDIALGTPPTIFWGGLAVIGALTFQLWGPTVVKGFAGLGTAIAKPFIPTPGENDDDLMDLLQFSGA